MQSDTDLGPFTARHKAAKCKDGKSKIAYIGRKCLYRIATRSITAPIPRNGCQFE